MLNSNSSHPTHIFVIGVIHRSSIPGVSIKSDTTFKFQKNLSSHDLQDGDVAHVTLPVFYEIIGNEL